MAILLAKLRRQVRGRQIERKITIGLQNPYPLLQDLGDPALLEQMQQMTAEHTINTRIRKGAEVNAVHHHVSDWLAAIMTEVYANNLWPDLARTRANIEATSL